MKNVDIKKSNEGSVLRQYYAAIVVNILCFCQGCTTAWVSPSLPILLSKNSPLGAPLTDTESYLLASLTCVSGTICTPIFGWIAERFGRKTGLLISGIPYLLAWGLKLLWYSSTVLVIARFLVGIGAAGIFMLSPIYCIEIANLEVKGTLGSFTIFSINGGILAMYILGVLFDYGTVLSIMIPLPLIFIVLMYRLPETPSYLVKSGNVQQAAKSLAWFKSLPVDNSEVRKEIEYLKSENDLDMVTDQQTAWNTFKSSAPTRKAIAILSIILTINICMGTFAIVSYAEDIFHQAGSNISPSLCSIILGSLLLLGSIGASTFVEKLGRKILLIGSCFIVGFALSTMATFFYVQNSGINTENFRIVPVIALSLALCTFAMGAGPIPYILPSELLVLPIRGAATSMLMTWVWFLSFIIGFCFGPAVSLFGMSTVFYFFAFSAFSGAFVTYFFIPETKGKPVEESLAFYDKNKRRPAYV